MDTLEPLKNQDLQNLYLIKMEISKLFTKPSIIGLIADQHTGKSNLIYYMLDDLKAKYKFKVFVYGLRCTVTNTQAIHSVAELEQIENSIIIIDEMFSLFDLDNRKVKAMIERTIRLIFHNNNVLLLCGLADNFKKFLSAKLNIVIFKQTTISNLINGSRVKNILMSYNGNERGDTILKLLIDEALIYDGSHYHKINIPYMKQYDSKLKNVPIIVRKQCNKKVVKENKVKK